MTLIVCLGNPGSSYTQTRHNIGFRVADALISHFNFESRGNKFKSLFYQTPPHEDTPSWMLIKPQTYMNLSGQAVSSFLSYFRILPSQLLVIYDDVDLPFGVIRLRAKGSPGTHNGMKSIRTQLQTSDFPRLRFGIGAAPPHTDISDYVLSRFTSEEERALPDLISRTVDCVDMALTKGLEHAMSIYNDSA